MPSFAEIRPWGADCVHIDDMKAAREMMLAMREGSE